MSAQDFTILAEIGKGAYSSVYRVRRKSDGKEYALKKVRLQALKEKEKSNALNEVRILASITSEYVVSYKDAFIEDSTNSLCIIMEFADGGDLQHKINTTIKTRSRVPESEVWKIIRNILNGLKVLHDMKIVHRDIKAANIFISDGLYKLGDLNVSKILERGLAYTQTGTPYYASPEVWRDQPYDSKSDIWSLGCVLYEVCELHPPFQARDMQGLYKKVQLGKFERLSSRYSQSLQRFIEACLQLDPYVRPSCQELLRSPYLHGKVEEQSNQHNNLLDTIQIPKNLQRLKGMLPKSKYEETETTSERIPSRKSSLTEETKDDRHALITQKKPSYSNMISQLSVRNKLLQLNAIDHNYPDSYRGNYLESYQGRQEGSYDLVKQKLHTNNYHQQPPHASIRSRLNEMNTDIEQKLLLRQKHLLGGLPKQYHSLDKHKDLPTHSVKLPAIMGVERPAVMSLKANQKQTYEHNRPSWWG